VAAAAAAGAGARVVAAAAAAAAGAGARPAAAGAVRPATRVGDAWYDPDADAYAFACPHEECGQLVQVPRAWVNCRIFRHGALRANGALMNPHAPRAECERLAREGLIDGCGRPFHFDGARVRKEDYI
jgi:hypothetical protein